MARCGGIPLSIRFLLVWTLLMVTTISWMFVHASEHREGDPIAELIQHKGRVEVKKSGSFSWSNEDDGSHLFSLDSLATGTSSSAVLRIKDGTIVKVPGDTQLKIVLRPLAQGFEIVLQAGGVSIEAPSQLTSSKRAGRPNALMFLTTAHYQIDLSELRGSFQINANGKVRVDHPETIRVNGPQQVLRLVDAFMVEDMDTNGPRQMDEVGIIALAAETIQPPQESASPIEEVGSRIQSNPASTSHSEPRRPEPRPAATHSPKKPERLRAPGEPLQFPEVKLARSQYWTKSSLQDAKDVPLVLSVDWNPSGAPGWASVFRIQSAVTGRSMVFPRQVSDKGLVFSLRELQDILPEDWGRSQKLILETGLQRMNKESPEVRWGSKKTTFLLQSLLFRSPILIRLKSWSFARSRDAWLTSDAKYDNAINIWLSDPSLLGEMEGFLRGSGSFQIEPAQGKVNPEFDIGIVRGDRLIMMIDQKSFATTQTDIRQRFQVDLIFRGSAANFLGGHGTFDLYNALNKNIPVYYLKNRTLLKIDSDLFSSPAIADNFIKQLNPYFFSQPVEILYTGGDELR